MDDLTAVEARTLLASAFVEDPLMRWFFPDDDTRPHACAALFGLFAEQYLAAGRVDVVRRTRPVAVAMWRWPGTAAAEQPESLPTPPGLMTALMGAARAAEVGAAMGVISELRPPEPYAYLHLLGVDPAVRGQGLGGEVLEPGLGAARGRRTDRLPGDDEPGQRALLRGARLVGAARGRRSAPGDRPSGPWRPDAGV